MLEPGKWEARGDDAKKVERLVNAFN